MPRAFAFVTAAFVLALAGTVAAQEPLTVAHAVEEALAHNPSLQAARFGAAEAAAREAEARSSAFPRISFSEAWQRGNPPVFVFGSLLSARQFAARNFAIDALNHPDATNFFRTALGVEQTLFDGGRRRSASDSAAARHQMAGAAADEAAAALALTTTQTFGRVLAAEASHRAADAALVAAREDLASAGRRRDAGMATDADVLALAAHVADLHQRVIQSEGDAAVARAELNRLMGAPLERDYRVIEPSGADAAPGDMQDLQAQVAEAEAARPELRRAAAAERLADAERSQTRSALVPSAAAQAAFDVSGTRFGDRTPEWLVGGEVRWSLSLGGAELARMRAASESRSRARAEAEDAHAAVRLDVVSARRRLETARARQAAGRAAVDQARESQRIIRNRFEAGLAGAADVLRASSAVLDAETQRISSVVDAVVSEALLRRALGRTP